MSYRHRDYSPLREAHANALEKLNNHIEHGPQRGAEGEGRTPEAAQQVQQGHDLTAEAGPTRPEGHYRDRAVSSDRGDMPSQQRAANHMHDRANEHARAGREANPEHAAKLEALNEHINKPEKGRDQGQEPGRDPSHENDIER